MLALLFALDLAACAHRPEQPNSRGSLATLFVFCVVTAGRIIGVCFGLAYCRWSPIGALAFGGAQVTLAGIAVLAVADARAWSAVARFFTSIGAAWLTGLLAALIVGLIAGSYVTMRRLAE
jgi:hypothetical protein